MALTIRIPGLLRLVLLRRPDEIEAVNDAAAVARPLSGRGGLINKAIAAKLQAFRSAEDEAWPAFRDRRDGLRAQHQQALEALLADTQSLLARISPEISELADHIRGRAKRDPGIIIQQAVGRLFFPDYIATEESYKATQTLAVWLSPNPIKSFLVQRSGALARALDLIMRLARGNMACAHATGIAMENIVRSVGLMRELARSGTALTTLSPQEAVASTLRAPNVLLRETRDSAWNGARRIPPRSLILMLVEKARRRSRDPGFAFFAGGWNRCPAHAFVPALLAEIWRRAGARAKEPGKDSAPQNP